MNRNTMVGLNTSRGMWKLVPVLMSLMLLAFGTTVQAWDLEASANPLHAGYVRGASSLYSTSGVPATGVVNWVQLSASASTNYHFVEWIAPFGDEFQFKAGYTSTSSAIRVTSTNDTYVSLQAVFSADTVSLTMIAGVGGTTDPTGTVAVAKGSIRSILAEPSVGYTFDKWSGAAGVTDAYAASTTILMDASKTVTANFKAVLRYTRYDPNGPASGSLSTNLTGGQLFTASPFASIINVNDDLRQRCMGWTSGAGDIPASGLATSYVYMVSTASSNRWVWTNEYRVTVTVTPGGTAVAMGLTATPDTPQTHWIKEGTPLVVSPNPAVGYVFSGWQVGSESLPIGDFSRTVTNAFSVLAKFSVIGSDADKDELPDVWENRFGLSTEPGAGALGNDGPKGDPDKDGLSNAQEYLIQATNSTQRATVQYSNPLDADSDGDGMDDFYERNFIDPTNLTADTANDFVSAVLDKSINPDNGPAGNPDGDLKWSTTTGYRMMAPAGMLSNIDEWRGPDMIDPCSYSNVTFGQSGYPFTTDRGTVKIKVINPVDTDDQSRGNNIDSDSDNFDDGFEYSWDRWQQNPTVTNEVFLIGVSNAAPIYITNTVPVWDGSNKVNNTRRFNPNKEHVDPEGASGASDNDVLYDYLTGGVSTFWYSDLLEYNASAPNAFSPTIPEAPHSIRRDQPPTPDDPPRCSHPFLVDFDKDGLPDGYEVIFGYDPWTMSSSGSVGTDAKDNPDQDWMAIASTNNLNVLRNHEIYVANGFNPYTAWAQFYPAAKDMPGPGVAAAPNTGRYNNREEMWGPNGVMALMPRASEINTDDATNPRKVDSDDDGIWDGWEGYIGLNPNEPIDAGVDTDADKLSNLGEFQSFVTSSTNRSALTPTTNWLNKIFPTDPLTNDTDGDGLADAAERDAFNGDIVTVVTNWISIWDEDEETWSYTQQVFEAGVWNKACYTSGGLNPTSWDTDSDKLPDPFEISFATAVNGTFGDAYADADNDKLMNYQEYMTAAVYHWQYDFWSDGLPVYDASDFFQGQSKTWDWRATDPVTKLPMRYIPILTPGGALRYSSTSPGSVDTDLDGMDDYWETYHGLNPTYGMISLPASRLYKPIIPVPSSIAPWLVGDPRVQPWVNGTPEMDSDGDGLPNDKEAVDFIQQRLSPTYHSDPSPLWITDPSYGRSWVNLYYVPGLSSFAWPWGLIPPTWTYDYEINEGFDTDNDNIGDYPELNQTFTDKLTTESPIKRRALYLPTGRDAYARTSPQYYFAAEALRSFTVEAWVRPLTPAAGQTQIVVERPLLLPIGNPLGGDSLRINFRLGLDADGVPFVEYTGEGDPVIFYQAKSASMTPLSSTNWTHLAGTYQVAAPGGVGRLTLYVNGKVAQSTTPSELPAIGRYGNAGLIHWAGAPIVVGAGDNNPVGTALAISIYQPEPHNYFKGWIDEVRIWNGARTQADVVAGMKRRMKQVDALAYATSPTAQLYGLYTFDDLPDPDRSPVSPDGFDVVMMNNRPSDWTSCSMWSAAADRSMRYTDYNYLPWIENAAAHIPEQPAVDIGDPRRTNEAYYVNTSNPYGMRYFTAPDVIAELNPIAPGYLMTPAVNNLTPQFTDLLPLRWAEADEDIAMWDGGGVPSTTPFDSDGDGLPDAWEEQYGLDPLDATGANGATGDLDGDELTNFVEYRCGLNPSSGDSDGDGVPDKNEDSDGDFLINLQELVRGTLPDMKDTDDDGLTDWEEVTGFTDTNYVARPATSPLPVRPTDPLNPLEPSVPRSVYLNGNARVIVPPSNKLMSEDWTLEMWVKPDTNSAGGVLVSRYLGGVLPGQSGINYEMGLTTNAPAGKLRPYIRYSTTSTAGEQEVRLSGAESTAQLDPAVSITISNGVWTHVAGTYNSISNAMAIYINGKRATWRSDAIDLPPVGFGYSTDHAEDEVTIGAARTAGPVTQGYRGYLDEVRIWPVTRSAAEIADRFNAPEAVSGEAGNTITLKSRAITALGGLASDIQALPAGQPIHALVQFNTATDAKAKAQLELAGIKVLNYAGEKARVVSATKEQLTALGDSVRWSGTLRSMDKIASKLAVDGTHGTRQVLVLFHKDVALGNALQVVQTIGGSGAVYGNAYISGTYLVASLNDAQVVSLAANDAVAWVMPAASFLTSGRPVRHLSEMKIDGVEVAPFAVLGNGWDGPGRGAANLTYYFVNDTTKMAPATARKAVTDQLAKWSAVAALSFSQAAVPNLSSSFDIAWYIGAHGDGGDFDGPYGVLGHGFYPNDINPEPIAGDFHLDDDETWQIGIGGAGIDIEYVSLHEMGHCLGMAHSDDPNALMYPFYDGTRGATLAQDDIDGIQSIYGLPATPGGPPSPVNNVGIFRFDDGGLTAQDFTVASDWLTGWASAAILDGAVFATNAAPMLDKDTDGDGMPDWWEMAYGLDPYDSTGRNGAYGDPDNDGLANLYEYLSHTSPDNPDSDKDGFSDYDSRGGAGNRTYGEMYDDGDGIPDEWEINYRGPCAATGRRGLDPAYYDAQLDPDLDGWSNYSEYMSGTDPLVKGSHPRPKVSLHLRYAGRLGRSVEEAIGVAANKSVLLQFYTTPAMDDYPDAILAALVSEVSAVTFDDGYVREGNNYVFAFLDDDGNGEWDPTLEPAGIGQFQPVNLGWGDVNNLEIGLTDTMPGYPRLTWPVVDGARTYAITNANVNGPGYARTMKVPRNYIHEGDYLYAGLYGMGTGSKTFQVRADESPVVVTSMPVNLPVVTLATPTVTTGHDFVYKYARNELEFTMDANATAYRLQVGLATNLTPVISVTNVVPYRADGVSKVTLPFYAGDNYVPTNSSYASGTWTNGRYWVRVQAATIATSSSYSPWSAINLELRSPAEGGRCQISGDVYYFGKVSHGYGPGQTNNLTIIVQSFESPGFSGVAEGQVQVMYTCNTNVPMSKKGDYVLKGLDNKIQYVRAFIDVNGNRILDSFEPMGFAQESTTETDYQALPVDLRGQAGVAKAGVRVVIRDRDTDDDQLPDGWEWMYYGTTNRGAGDIGSNTLTLLRNYEIEPLDLDPTKKDYDKDGLDDAFEITYSEFVVARAGNSNLTVAAWMASGLGDINHYEPYPANATSEGTDLSPILWDTDGDGLSDAYEVFNGLDPLNPFGDADGDGITDAQEVLITRTSPVAAADALRVKQVATVTPGVGLFSLTWAGSSGATYQVQYSDDLRVWQDAPNGAFSGAADHIYVEQSPGVSVRFYRVVGR